MVKPKQQKLPKKQSHMKRQGKQVDISQLRNQLDALGLCIVEVTADGNCFFRAVADQLEGNEEEHQKYRSMVVKRLLENQETFEPFIEDEVSFAEYCQSMEEDGTWAGHMEVQAASLVTHCNICIHQNMSPRWYIRNFDDCKSHMIHLSYHDGEHYNSVRLKEDPGDGPAKPIIIKADADISASSHQAKATANKPNAKSGREIIQPGSIKLVMARSGCKNAAKVEQILHQVNGDVDAATEFLIAEQEMEECLERSDMLPSQADNSYGGHGSESHNQQKENYLEKSHKNDAFNNTNSTLEPDDKKIPRNKVCPCGSKKKYKSCCGSVAGKSSTKLVLDQTGNSRKARKERKQGKKTVLGKGSVSYTSDGAPPDMGALCI